MMHPTTRQNVIRMLSYGWKAEDIAVANGVDTEDVEAIVRELSGQVPRKRPLDEMGQAKAEMLRAGYDRSVVEANFGT